MSHSDHTLPDALRPAVSALLDLFAASELVDIESSVMSSLMSIGRAVMRDRLSSLSPAQGFSERSVEWKVAVESRCEVITLFGPVLVERPLFRSERNGPTRCLVREKAALIDGLWTPHAAKVATLAMVEMPAAQAESLLRETGVVNASRSSLNRLVGSLSDGWEADREAHEQLVRDAMTGIPAGAATVAVSLDGVMVMKTDSARAEVKAATRRQGVADKGPAGWEEASVGVLSFYDKSGERLATRRYARMPEADKRTTKAWVAAELASVRARLPNITTLAIADGATNNWSFLETLSADHEVVDFFHAAEHLHRHVSKANGAATVETQALLQKMRRKLLSEPGAAVKVFKSMMRLREKAGTATPKAAKKKGRNQPTFFEQHHKRMDYAKLREMNLPIGSGVTESTCKLAVCDRLRRTGMRWSQRGGQAILTFRALRISGQFDAAWVVLMQTNRRSLAA